MIRMHSDAILSSIGASRMKTFIKKYNALQQIVILYKQLLVQTHQTDICESAFMQFTCLSEARQCYYFMNDAAQISVGESTASFP